MRVDGVSRAVPPHAVDATPRLSREARRVSDGHVDGVAATWHRVDAIDATTSSRRHRRSLEDESTLVQDHFANSCDQFESVDKGATTKNGPGTPRSSK